jgi:hypothetical protein
MGPRCTGAVQFPVRSGNRGESQLLVFAVPSTPFDNETNFDALDVIGLKKGRSWFAAPGLRGSEYWLG